MDQTGVDQTGVEQTNVAKRRAVLVAPASDERKARKALASHADEVVLDLEDAVTPENKESARAFAAELVAEFGASRSVSLRINAFGTPWVDADLAACAAMDSLSAVVLPKAESAQQLRTADERLGNAPARLQILLETPIGIRDANEICAATDRLDAVLIGYADLGAALGRSAALPMPTWQHVQETVLIAARAAGASVVDGPHLTIADDEGFREAKRWVRDLGFDGTWVIHPGQIDAALDIFTSSPEAVEDARRVLDALAEAAAAGAGAAELDGRMLDEALAVAARRTLVRGGVDV